MLTIGATTEVYLLFLLLVLFEFVTLIFIIFHRIIS